MDEPGHSAPAASHFSLRHVLKSEWPYLLVLVLALFGTWRRLKCEAAGAEWPGSSMTRSPQPLKYDHHGDPISKAGPAPGRRIQGYRMKAAPDSGRACLQRSKRDCRDHKTAGYDPGKQKVTPGGTHWTPPVP